MTLTVAVVSSFVHGIMAQLPGCYILRRSKFDRERHHGVSAISPIFVGDKTDPSYQMEGMGRERIEMIVDVSLVALLVVVVISFRRAKLPVSDYILVNLHRVPREKHIKEAKRRGEIPLQG